MSWIARMIDVLKPPRSSPEILGRLPDEDRVRAAVARLEEADAENVRANGELRRVSLDRIDRELAPDLPRDHSETLRRLAERSIQRVRDARERHQ